MFDAEKFGQEMGAAIREAVSPLIARIAELEKRPTVTPEQVEYSVSKAVPTAETISTVVSIKIGEHLQDRATMQQVEAAIEKQVSKSVFMAVDGLPKPLGLDAVEKMIAKAVAAIPPALPGKDGVGLKGDKGDPGTKGADGVGLAGAMIDRDGNLMATLTNGEVKNLGPVVGKDGIGFESFDMEYLPESHEVAIKASAAGRTKELRFPAGGIRPGGYWREGTKAKAGEAWVQGGSTYFCLHDTPTKPEAKSADWIIAAQRGRDGETIVKTVGPVSPIKL
jgi:hypothetical protein